MDLMLNDIFSGFDDHNQVFMDFSYLVWFFLLFLFLGFFFSFWCSLGSFWSFLFSFVHVVDGLVVRSGCLGLGSSVPFFRVLFLFIFFFNVFGLVPYVFSLTSHLAVNLSLSLPIWLSVVVAGIFYDFGSFISHFQPLGAPALLSPFLCVVELVSLLVRPVTLSVRLTANLSTGHVIMSLLGIGFGHSFFFLGVFILFLGVFYFLFELGVCFVQSYIFTLLPVLYADEHPS